LNSTLQTRFVAVVALAVARVVVECDFQKEFAWPVWEVVEEGISYQQPQQGQQ
jgi:hypothetical protein